MGENKQKNYINNIFYGVVGVATLMVAIMGATFAYFTATAGNNEITGNMATIDFDLQVKKVTNADNTIGVIPMSNNMMEQAVSNKSTKGVCVDDNGNAVCQIYKITVINESTASMFVDGYVTLTGGSGNPVDFNGWQYAASGARTTMRWAQVFCNEEEADGMVKSCTTAGKSTVRPDTEIGITALGGEGVANSGLNTGEIKSDVSVVTNAAVAIKGNPYRVINSNYIRVSDHLASDTTYDREDDITSALVYSQYLDADNNSDTDNTGTSSSTFADAQVYYVVIWLSETGTNQTANSGAGTASKTDGFYQGKVTFISSQGSEVTATFADHTKVTPTS